MYKPISILMMMLLVAFLGGWTVPDLDFVTPDEDTIVDPFTSGEVEALYNDAPPDYGDYDDGESSCLGPQPLTRVVGGCTFPRMVCVCGEKCYWMQVCNNEGD